MSRAIATLSVTLLLACSRKEPAPEAATAAAPTAAKKPRSNVKKFEAPVQQTSLVRSSISDARYSVWSMKGKMHERAVLSCALP